MTPLAKLIIGAITDFIITAGSALAGYMVAKEGLTMPSAAMWLLSCVLGAVGAAKQVRGMLLDVTKTAVVLLVTSSLLAGCSAIEPLQQFTLKDLRAGQARAEKAGDAPWAKCMKVLGDQVERQSAADVAPPVGLADAVVLAHLVYARSQQGMPTQLKADCAEVAVDLILFAARIGLDLVPGGSIGRLILR